MENEQSNEQNNDQSMAAVVTIGLDEAEDILKNAGYFLDLTEHDYEIKKVTIELCKEQIQLQREAEAHGNYQIGINDGLQRAASECQQLIIKDENKRRGISMEYDPPYDRRSEGFIFPD